jgi:hypothetical protein
MLDFSVLDHVTQIKKPPPLEKLFEKREKLRRYQDVRHVTGNDQDYLRKIPRAVVQISALL